MKFRQNEEAVSPVIGVILMVAITVILAAVIAAFVFGMGTPQKTPQASLVVSSASASTRNITITHSGGDAIDLNKVKAIIEQGTNRNTIALLNATGSQILYAGDSLRISQNTTIVVAVNNVNVASPGTNTSNFQLATGLVTVTLLDTDSSQQIGKLTATVN